MIPAEAVEAAAKALWINTRLDPYNGDSATAIVIRHQATLALEAAAPYIIAEYEKQRKYDALDSIRALGSDEPIIKRRAAAERGGE